jgi:hypothetical protein
MSSHNNMPKIADLPVVLLVLAFKHCCYREVAENIRPVCRKFYNATPLVLNSELCILGRKIHRTMVAVEQNMMRTQIESHFQALNRVFNTVEIVKSRYRLRAVTWRYVSSSYRGYVPLSCFYGRLLLHEFGQLLRLACTSPGDVIFQFLRRFDL